MGVLSGKAGDALIGASELLDITNWTLEYGANIETFAARSGGGAEETVEGLEGGTGTIELVYNSDQPITGLVSPGDLISLTLRHDATNMVQATGQARLGRFGFGANRDGTTQRVTIPFTCHKAWTLPS